MKKIGIVTIVDYDNYGNRLQNYALSRFLQESGVHAVTIKNEQSIKKSFSDITNKLIKLGLVGIVKKIDLKFKKTRYSKIVKRRNNRFIQFTKKHIIETDFIINRTDIRPGLNDEFDMFIVGSDQIWNPVFRGINDFDLLSFADDNKKYSVSASFGTYALNDKYHDHFRNNLKTFKKVSVREDAGVQIVNKLVGTDPSLLIDPTMAISKDQWQSVIYSHSEKPKSKYILIYALGGINKEMKKLLNKIESIDDYVVISLVDLQNPTFYDADPFEFVDLIKDADLFITDSYHGVVFSIIFSTPFIVTSRTGFKKALSMNSRMDTVLSYFDMDDRRVNNILESNSDFFEFKNEKVNKILKNKICEFEEYIKEIIK